MNLTDILSKYMMTNKKLVVYKTHLFQNHSDKEGGGGVMSMHLHFVLSTQLLLSILEEINAFLYFVVSIKY